MSDLTVKEVKGTQQQLVLESNIVFVSLSLIVTFNRDDDNHKSLGTQWLCGRTLDCQSRSQWLCGRMRDCRSRSQ